MTKYSDMTEDQQKVIVQEATAGVVTGAAMVAAVRNLRKGRIGHALFYLLLWKGYTDNTENQRAARRHKEAKEHWECQHLTMKMVAGIKSPRPTPSTGPH